MRETPYMSYSCISYMEKRIFLLSKCHVILWQFKMGVLGCIAILMGVLGQNAISVGVMGGRCSGRRI